MNANKRGATNLKVGSTENLRMKREEIFCTFHFFVQLLSLGEKREAPNGK